MEKYENGKIYKIISGNSDMIYIGSTTRALSVRLSEHKVDDCTCSSRKVIGCGDYSIVLLELFPCNSKLELETREKHYIQTLNCVNLNVPARTQKEYYQDNKTQCIIKVRQYYQNNKQHISNTKKEHYQDKKPQYQTRAKQYYQNNKQHLLNKAKKYQEDNKETLSIKRGKIISCDCGFTYSMSNRARHLKSKKHNN